MPVRTRESWRWLAAWILAFVIVSGFQKVCNADASENLSGNVSLKRATIRVTSAVSDALIETVARLALPSELTVPAGEYPERVIRSRCGAYTKVYEKIFLEFNPGLRFDIASQDRQVRLPACLRWTNKTSVELRSDDNLETVVSREIGVSLDTVIIPCQENTRSSRCGKSVRALVKELNPNINLDNLEGVKSLVLPITTRWTTLTFTSEAIRSLENTPLSILRPDADVRDKIKERTNYVDPWSPQKGLVQQILQGTNTAIAGALSSIVGSLGHFAGADLIANEQQADALIQAGEVDRPVPAALAAAVNLTTDPAILGSSPGPDAIDLVRPVDISSTDVAEPSCRDAAQSHDWPLVVRAIQDAYSTSAEEANKRELFNQRGTGVLVVDTGITRLKELFAPNELSLNPREVALGEGDLQDRDHNGYNNDVIGIDSDGGGNPSAPKDYPRYKHGTEVALLAAGGPVRDEISGIRGTVRLRFAKVVRVTGVQPDGSRAIRVATDGLSDAISYAGRNQLPIANVSIAASSPIVAVEDALRNNPELLLIVAAGNEQAPLDFSPVYPAAYGGSRGSFSKQVLTVAAHDLKGDIAGFSNRSASYTDIAAPGCDILYRDEDRNDVHLFGTSFAAPLVTFTAALLKTLGLDGPSAIKERIIFSADYDGARLGKFVSSGSRLDIAKALYVFDDLLEMEGDGPLLVGTWRQGGTFACKSGEVVPRAKLRKVSRVAIAPEIRVRYVWQDFSGNAQVGECTPAESGITFQTRGAPAATVVEWEKIKDFVAATFPPQ